MTHTGFTRLIWMVVLAAGYTLTGGALCWYTFVCWGVERPAGGEWGGMFHFYVFVVLIPLLALVTSAHLQMALYDVGYRVYAYVKDPIGEEPDFSWLTFSLTQIVLFPLAVVVTVASASLLYALFMEPFLRMSSLSEANDYFALAFSFMALLPPYVVAHVASSVLLGALLRRAPEPAR